MSAVPGRGTLTVTLVVASLLLCCVLGGCAGSLHLASLPTDEQRCLYGGGVFHAGLCEYCR